MLKEREIKIIYGHALKEYPYECCGIVTGDGNGSNSVHTCINIQQELHKKDPVDFPRDARTAYYIDPKEMFNILKKSEEAGEKVVCFYHSHPEHGAYFSDTDREQALLMGEPVYPGAEYLVVSVFSGAIKETALYQWDSNKQDFIKK